MRAAGASQTKPSVARIVVCVTQMTGIGRSTGCDDVATLVPSSIVELDFIRRLTRPRRIASDCREAWM